MAKWFYFNQSGEKIETDSDGLKRLAENGIISEKTTVESADGKQVMADKVKGLTFKKFEDIAIDPPPVQSEPIRQSDSAAETAPPYDDLLGLPSRIGAYLKFCVFTFVVCPILFCVIAASVGNSDKGESLLAFAGVTWAILGLFVLLGAIKSITDVLDAFSDFAKIMVQLDRASRKK